MGLLLLIEYVAFSYIRCVTLGIHSIQTRSNYRPGATPDLDFDEGIYLSFSYERFLNTIACYEDWIEEVLGSHDPLTWHSFL